MALASEEETPGEARPNGYQTPPIRMRADLLLGLPSQMSQRNPPLKFLNVAPRLGVTGYVDLNAADCAFIIPVKKPLTLFAENYPSYL